jgi:hypothetical protein
LRSEKIVIGGNWEWKMTGKIFRKGIGMIGKGGNPKTSEIEKVRD